MDKTVGQLIYEITAKIAGGFNVTMQKAEKDFDNLTNSANKTETAFDEIKRKSIELTNQFRSGAIGFAEYKKGLDSLSKEQEIVTQFGNLSKAQQSLVKDFQNGKISLEDFNKQMKNGTEASGLFGKGLSYLKIGLAGLALAGLNFVKNFLSGSIKQASDLNESMSKTAVIFGSASKAIFEFADTTANSLGISRKEALDASSDFAIFGKSAGLSGDDLSDFSKKLVTLSADLASFFNTDPKQAATAIGAALRGESEPIRKYGVLLNDVTIKAEAMRLGLGNVGATLTANQRTLAVTSLLFKQTSDAQGDFARTSDGLANQQRILQANFQNLQGTIGGSFTQAMRLVQSELGKLLGSLTGSPEQFNNFAKGVYQTTAGIIAFVKIIGGMLIALAKTGQIVFDTASIIGGYFVDRIKGAVKGALVFKDAMLAIKDGNFKEGFSGIKDALKEIGSANGMEETKKRIQATKEAVVSFSEAMEKNNKSVAESIEIAATGKGFEPITQKQYNDLTKGTTAVEELGTSTSGTAQKTDELKKQLQGIAEEAIKAGDALEKGLGESYKKYGENIASSIKETQNKLAGIIVDAEKKKADLQAEIAKGGDTTAQQAELEQVQKILDARVGYEQRAQEQIAEIKKKFADAGLDPNALGLDKQLAGQKTLEEQIAEQKRLASLDEFTRFEEENKAKLLLLAEQAIQELLIQKNKIDTQKKYEQELTDFVLSKNKLKADSVTQFANEAITKYGEMANALKNVLSLENQIKSGKGGSGLPQFHDGGYVGSQGGQVHAGEFVIPANLVNSMPSLISQLDGLRNGGQTNNISITAGGNTSADFSSVAEELAWRLRRL